MCRFDLYSVSLHINKSTSSWVNRPIFLSTSTIRSPQVPQRAAHLCVLPPGRWWGSTGVAAASALAPSSTQAVSRERCLPWLSSRQALPVPISSAHCPRGPPTWSSPVIASCSRRSQTVHFNMVNFMFCVVYHKKIKLNGWYWFWEWGISVGFFELGGLLTTKKM